MSGRLVARLDNAGDVLLAGPAVRAVAATAGPVTFLAGPAGRDAARLLPGVGDVVTIDAPWVGIRPPPSSAFTIGAVMDDVVRAVRAAGVNEAVILTSFHQSALPLAMLLRLAGVERVAATCVDYPGSLLDVRHPYLEGVHEVEQSLALCRAAGHDLPDGDDRLAVLLPERTVEPPAEPYVVVHPGASVPARALPPDSVAPVVTALAAQGYDVALTGSVAEATRVQLLAALDGGSVQSYAGRTDLGQLGHLVAGAVAVVCGNTLVAHLAAAVGTPVVEAFAPVVSVARWRPWRVPHVVLGDLGIECRGCRSRSCPIEGQPCLDPFTPDAVVAALDSLASPRCVA